MKVLFSTIACTFLFFSLSLSPSLSFSQSSADSCTCEVMSCHSVCEYEESVSFYTEKCESGKKVKSCAKPKCLPVDPAPLQCVDLIKSAPPVTAVEAQEQKVVEATKPLGQIIDLVGLAILYRGGEPLATSTQQLVMKDDKIVTEEGAKVVIEFLNTNRIVIDQKTTIIMTEPSRLDLLKGRLRSQIKKNQETHDQSSSFQVSTPTAVAGVRGTDFIVSFGFDQQDLVSEIKTLTGEVELRSLLDQKKESAQKNEKVEFRLKNSAAFLSSEGALSPSDWKGLTHIKKSKFDNKDTQDFNELPFVVAQRTPQSAVVSVADGCRMPQGQFNQCSWTCENNPKGQSTCRTDLPGVQCVRRYCNANGIWADAFRLPASHSVACQAQKIVVDQCDY